MSIMTYLNKHKYQPKSPLKFYCELSRYTFGHILTKNEKNGKSQKTGGIYLGCCIF